MEYGSGQRPRCVARDVGRCWVRVHDTRAVTPASGVVPTAQEVAPWVAVIERLWDDAEFEAEHRRRALAEARRWDSFTLGDQYQKFFLSLARDEWRRFPFITASKQFLTILQRPRQRRCMFVPRSRK